MTSITTKTLALVLVLALLGLSACFTRTPQSTITAESTPLSQIIAEPPVSEKPVTPDRLVEKTKEALIFAPIISEMGTDFGRIDFTIHIPESWIALNMELFENNQKVSEVPSARPIATYQDVNGNDLGPFSETDFSLGGESCIASGDFTAGQYAGKYYHRQYELDGIHSDVTFCLNTGLSMVLIQFNLNKDVPAQEQIDKFIDMAKTIEIVKEDTLLAKNTQHFVLPSSDKGKTEFNAAIYEIDPLYLYALFPDGWTTKEREVYGSIDAEIALANLWNVRDIFDVNGELIGALGYNTYEEYEGAENDPRAIYNQIALGNNYKFDVRDSYTVVSEREIGATAVCNVLYSANLNNGIEKTNRGIVSYNRSRLAYVAFEFAGDKVTETQVADIAKSISLD